MSDYSQPKIDKVSINQNLGKAKTTDVKKPGITTIKQSAPSPTKSKV